MRIALTVPFGSMSQESGVIYLLANYLRSLSVEVLALTCNGAFSVCDRDRETSWKRGVETCLVCMGGQKELVAWSGIREEELSRFISPSLVEETKRWIVSLPARDLFQAEFRGVKPFELSRKSFSARFGAVDPDLNNRNHEQFLRRFMLGVARMALATRRFNTKLMPDLTLVAHGEDFITQTVISELKAASRGVVVFKWDHHTRSVNITHPFEQKTLSCEVLIERVSAMRNDCKTWPPALIGIVEEILGFLGVSEESLKLAMVP